MCGHLGVSDDALLKWDKEAFNMVEEVCLLVNNNCYKANKKMSVIKGVMIHDTAVVGASPDTFKRAWNTAKPNGRSVCVHAFADNKKIVKTLNYTTRAWGCGSGSKGSGNDYYIQLEMCLPSSIYIDNSWRYQLKDDSAKKYIAEMVDLVVDWTTDRLINLGFKEVTTENVTSHYEAHNKGIASNHGDPKNLLSLIGLDMNLFRDKCRASLNNKLSINNKTLHTEGDDDMIRVYNTVDEVPDYARDLIKLLVEKKLILGREDGSLGLTDDLIRMLVINDRLGLFKEFK